MVEFWNENKIEPCNVQKKEKKLKFTEIDNVKKRSKKYLLDYTATVHLQT